MNRKNFMALLGAAPFAFKSLMNSESKVMLDGENGQIVYDNLLTKLRVKVKKVAFQDTVVIHTPKALNRKAFASVVYEGKKTQAVTGTKTKVPVHHIPDGGLYFIELKTTDELWTQENADQIIIKTDKSGLL